MPDPIFDSALLSMCMTWRHDFGLLDRKEQMEVRRELLGLYKHHVQPAIDRAEAAESSLAAMRQRAEEAERQLDAAMVRAKAAEFVAHTFSVACDAHKRRAERAESCLRSIKAITDSTRIDMTRPTRALTRIEELAYAVLSSPPADASKIGGERERRLVEALRHVCKHLCQWNDACETGCIVSAALAEMEQKS